MVRAIGSARLWSLPAAADALEAWVRAAGSLAAAAGRETNARSLSGRGDVWDVPAQQGGGRWVVRRYRRGGALASLLRDRYPSGGTPRPLRELVATEAARSRGIHAPRAIAAAAYPAGPLFYRGDLVTEKVEGARDLAAIVFGRASYDSPQEGRAAPAPREEALRAAGRLAAALAAAGVHHPDLNLKNVLIQGGEPWVVDLDRARLRAPSAAGAAMLRRLVRSLEKWERRTGTRLTPAEKGAPAAGFAEASSSG